MTEKELQYLLYQAEEENVSVQALVQDENIWLTQKSMCELFGVDKSSISKHLRNIFQDGELDEKVVVAKIATTTLHGALDGKTQTKDVNFYNLDAIISVGYRVNSRKATIRNFRKVGVRGNYSEFPNSSKNSTHFLCKCRIGENISFTTSITACLKASPERIRASISA